MALAFLPIAVLAQSGDFLIQAKVGQAPAPEKAYLIYDQAGHTLIDSAILTNGTFRFKGTLTEICYAQLILDHQGTGLNNLQLNGDIKDFYLEKGEIILTAKDSLKYAVISGSKLNDEYAAYRVFMASSEKALFVLNNTYDSASAEKKEDTAYTAKFKNEHDRLIAESRRRKVQYIEKHPDSYVSLRTLINMDEGDPDVAVASPLFESLSAGIRKTTTAQAYSRRLVEASPTAIGAIAPDFTEYDVNDKAVSLKDFRGKYVFLDFWASWCMPCRHENPNVLTAFNQYKSKNFTVLGISLDRPGQKADWLAAIKKDGLTWTQLDDFKSSPGQAVTNYKVSGIPQNYLIDPAGKIIAKNLRGDELSKKLADLFK